MHISGPNLKIGRSGFSSRPNQHLCIQILRSQDDSNPNMKLPRHGFEVPKYAQVLVHIIHILYVGAFYSFSMLVLFIHDFFVIYFMANFGDFEIIFFEEKLLKLSFWV